MNECSERKNHETQLRSLFLKAQENDHEAYSALLVEISQLLRVYLTQLMNPKVRSRERVEDLTQEILMTIHRKRDLYSKDLPLLPWIYAIAKYRFIDSVRAEARQPEFVEWIENQDTRECVQTSNYLEEDDSMELLASLTEKQRKILTMAKVDDVPLKEVAAHFQMSVSAVKVTIHRILKNLRI